MTNPAIKILSITVEDPFEAVINGASAGSNGFVYSVTQTDDSIWLATAPIQLPPEDIAPISEILRFLKGDKDLLDRAEEDVVEEYACTLHDGTHVWLVL